MLTPYFRLSGGFQECVANIEFAIGENAAVEVTGEVGLCMESQVCNNVFLTTDHRLNANFKFCCEL